MSEPSEELPRRNRGDGSRIVEVRRFMPKQEQDSPFITLPPNSSEANTKTKLPCKSNFKT